ncbi:MAG: rhomboid family intramembrane serine protease [Methyloceanibacter sp.]|nr:rhomboid family intramembrane serine protease [Methyloceanibacter sp.]
MFLPLHDRNTLRYIPFQTTTLILILLNVGVFIYQQTLTEESWGAFATIGGFIPASLLMSGGATIALPPGWEFLPPEITLITYMFLHGDFWHLLGNMVFLWVFGDNVEDAMGHFKFLIFYLICGIAAGIAHGIADPGSAIPLVGASGAIAGLIAAYVILHPRVRIWVLILGRIPLPLPAYLVLALWLATQILFIYFGDESGTAWWAHIGGFVAGVALVAPFKRADVPLFGRKTSTLS